jgi:hypothetical protein
MAMPFRKKADDPDWTPPDYVKDSGDSKTEDSKTDEKWTPPDYVKEKPSVFSKAIELGKKAWEKASAPLSDAPTRFAEQVSNYINPERTVQGVKGIGSAYIEGLGRTVSSLTSPENLALAASGVGEGLRIPGAAIASRILSAPVTAEGLENVYKGKGFSEKALGAIEAATGILGMKGGFGGEESNIKSDIKPDELPIRKPIDKASSSLTKTSTPSTPENEELPIRQTGKSPRLQAITDQELENLAKQRGTPEDIPDNPEARQLEAERQATSQNKPQPSAGETSETPAETSEAPKTEAVDTTWKPPDYVQQLEAKPEEVKQEETKPTEETHTIPPETTATTPNAQSAVDKLLSSLGTAKNKVAQQEEINRATRAQRFASFKDVQEEGVSGAAKSLSQLKGEFDKVNPGEQLGLKPEETDSLFTAVKKANLSSAEKAQGYTALFKLVNGEENPTRSELNVLDGVFGNGFSEKVINSRGGIGAVGLRVAKVANTMKSLQNSMSLAAPLRHGIGLAYRKEFYPAFADMFKFYGNKEFYNSSMKAIADDPKFNLAQDSGLFLAKPGSLLSSEEEFLNSYAGKIPVVNKMVAASQRGYSGFLNKLRFDTFNGMTREAQELGTPMSKVVKGQVIPTKEAGAIAKFINNASGRGDLGSLNRITNELNTVLWSPRMMASRINMFANPKLYMDLPKGMRLAGLKSLLGIAALGTSIDTLAAYGGAKVTTNILSSDFMKSRFGKNVIDPFGGLQQYVVAAARFLAGKTDTGPTTMLDVSGKFLKNKESPVASLAHNILTVKNPKNGTRFGPMGQFTTQYGEQTSVPREIAKSFIPIFISDLSDLVKSDPDWSQHIGLTSALAGASLAGMEQNYPEAKRKGNISLKKMSVRP